MQYTSAQAAKLLLKLQQEHDSILNDERITQNFVASANEDIESARPEYDYVDTKDRLHELEEKIRKVKHAISVFNAKTVIPEFGITIDEMLVLIPQLTREKTKLITMAGTLPKSRRNTYANNVVEYVYANYDISVVKADLSAVTDKLANAQLALDTVNHTETLEIDI